MVMTLLLILGEELRDRSLLLLLTAVLLLLLLVL